MFTTYSTLKDLAKHTQSALKLENTPFKYCFPYNPRKSEDLYWLSNGDKPAFPYKKIFFQHAPHGFNVGLHIEKGFEHDLDKKKERLTSKWDWNHFILQLRQGALEEFCRELESDQATLSIDLPPLAQQKTGYQIQFSLNPFACQQSLNSKNPLFHLQQANSGVDIANAIQKIPSREFYWIDFWIVLKVERKTNETEQVSDELIQTLVKMTALF